MGEDTTGVSELSRLSHFENTAFLCEIAILEGICDRFHSLSVGDIYQTSLESRSCNCT